MSLRITICCPHCKGKALARSSRELSRTMREIVFLCLDPECGHSYVSQLEVVRTLSPSAKPCIDVRLPISQQVAQRLMKQLELIS